MLPRFLLAVPLWAAQLGSPSSRGWRACEHGPELDRIDAVMQLVLEHHIEGERWTREELAERCLSGMLRALDAHSDYLSPEAYASFYAEMVEPVYCGVGAYVVVDPTDELITIARPIYSGPAYRAGLQSDDKIVQIDNWPTLGRTVDEVVERMKGRPGTVARLYVWRSGMSPELIERPTEDMALEIVRDHVAVVSVHQEFLPGGIALIELVDFNRLASRQLRAALEALMMHGLRALILDLRRNPGGLLEEARDVADLFLPEGKLVVTTRSRDRAAGRWLTLDPCLVPPEIPVVVLIDRYSASASEIVAGALQDHGRATVVGERSFGKGAVQTVLRVPGCEDDEFLDENRNGFFDHWERILVDHDGDGDFDFAPRLRLTYARYELPSGRSIHREVDEQGNVLKPGGITPDRTIALAELQGWQIEERARLRREGWVRRYVDRWWPTHRRMLEPLSLSDLRSSASYPEFEAFVRSLQTTLCESDVRALVRQEIRRRVQDESGIAFPLADYQEDLQVQEALRIVLSALGESIEGHLIYRAVLGPPQATSQACHGVERSAAPSDMEAAKKRVHDAFKGPDRIPDCIWRALLSLALGAR